MLNTYTFRVEMPCMGCVAKIQKILSAQQAQGAVISFTVSLEDKWVTVTTRLPVEAIHGELKRCGKPVALLSSSKQESFGALPVPEDQL